MKFLSILVLFAALVPQAILAQEPNKGIQGEKAPPLGVHDWVNLPEGKRRVGIPDYSGKILVMLFFQTKCEASQERAFPTLKRLVKKFGDSSEVGFLAVQTTFQNYTDNSALELEPTAKRFGLDIPIGHLAKTEKNYSINAAYKTGGTPWWVIVDRDSTILYNGFYLNPDEAEKNLEKMIAGLPL